MKLRFGKYEIRIGRVQRQPQPKRTAASGQLRDGLNNTLITKLEGYIPSKFDLELYELIREAIPFIDVAIIKLVRLIGDFEFDTFGDKRLLEKLNAFRRAVRVNYLGVGLDDFIYQMSDAAFHYGFGVGELIPTRSRMEVERLKVANSKYFKFKLKNGRLVLTQDFGIEKTDIEFNDNIFYLAFDKRNGHPQGYSLLYSLPFVADIFARIEKSIENVWWRAGDPTFVTTIQGGERTTGEQIKDAVEDVKKQMIEAMRARRDGKVYDIYTGVPMGGKILIDILGKEFKFPDLKDSVRLLLEQIVAKTGLPPFMLGLSWSTTERMSKDQNDMIVADTQYRRQQLDPILDEVIDRFLVLTGDAGKKWKKVWAPVNLLDVLETGRARYFEAFAMEKELQNYTFMLDMGWISEDEVIERLRGNKTYAELMKKHFGGNGKTEAKHLIELNRRIYARQIARRYGVVLDDGFDEDVLN